MQIAEIIRAKRDGEELDEEALRALVEGYTDGSVPDYQVAAFLMAVTFQGMSPEELAVWTDAMLRSGEVLDFDDIPGAKIDKHSTGGVGDKVSLVLAPLAVAAGVKVPMISGRGLGHTGGTLDKLESIPDLQVDLPVTRFRELVEQVGCGLIGQTGEIAPADRKLYALRDVTGTVDCIPLIASSIMSKKMAEGIDALVLDVKVGSGAFMKEVERARRLADTMIDLGEQMGRPVRAVLTDMNQPLGWAVGNALEVAECVDVMRGEGPEDLIEVTVELVAQMVDLAGQAPDGPDALHDELREMLADGRALEHFRQIIEAQGGDTRVCDAPREVLPSAPYTAALRAKGAGVVTSMETAQIGLAGVDLGAGRVKKEDDIDPGVGMIFHKRVGDRVEAGEELVTIHYRDEARYEACEARLRRAITVEQGAEPPELELILEVRGA